MLVGAAVATGVTTARLQVARTRTIPDPLQGARSEFLKYALRVALSVRTGLTWSAGPVWFGDGRYTPSGATFPTTA